MPKISKEARSMNENKYLYFIKIHELGSITKAAESLYISHPALSKYIRNLERELGVSLIEREYSPVRFTEAGEIYFRYAKEALKNYDKMRRDIAEAGISLSKTFTFGISTDLTKYFTKDIVKLPLEEDTNRFAFLPNFFISGNGLTDDVALCSVDGEAFPIFIVMARAKNRPLSGKAKKLVRAIRDFTDNSGI